MRITRWIFGFLRPLGTMKSVHVGEKQQPVGFHGCGKQGAEFVVVAEGALDLPHRHAVVFIHDGDHAQGKEFGERVLQIAIAHGRGEIVTRKQELRHDFLSEKKALVGVHQLALANSCAGLHARDIGGAIPELQARHARCDRA